MRNTLNSQSSDALEPCFLFVRVWFRLDWDSESE